MKKLHEVLGPAVCCNFEKDNEEGIRVHEITSSNAPSIREETSAV